MAGTRGDAGSTGRRSGASFPIIQLKDVIEMVRLIDRHGGRMRYDEIAGAMEQRRDSGAFRGKTAAGHMFGATETVSREASLTDLGRRMAVPETEADALTEAFLNVPLYRALFDRYAADGGKLPMTRDIDIDIERLGVSPNRAAKARQMFLRSAETAGYFRSGRDRLIRPSTGSARTAAGTITSMQAHSPELREAEQVSHAEAAPVAEHWLVKALVAELPPRDKPPTAAQLRHFMQTMQMNLETIYGVQIEESGEAAPQPSLNGAASVHSQPV
jgi:hypothetical protein